MITKQISDKNCSYYEGRGTNSRLLGAQRLVSAPRGPSQVSPSMTPDPNAGPFHDDSESASSSSVLLDCLGRRIPLCVHICFND